jgi:OmpA-OmpF porin, OOP family
MQKKLLILVLATSGLVAVATAHAEQPNGWFVNGNVGSSHYKAHIDGLGSGTENGTAFMVNAGYRDQRILGFEVGYTNLGNVSENDGYGDRVKLSGDGWTLGLNGHFNPTKQWYVSARGGAFLWKLSAKARIAYSDNSTDTFRGSEQSLGWYAGVGTGYDINRRWSVGANFDYYKIDKDYYDLGSQIFSVSAEYRF